MIAHYLKVAFRNLWKYKFQHIVSALCLAVGVLAFSLMIRFVSVMSEKADYIGGERAMQLNIGKKILPVIFLSMKKMSGGWKARLQVCWILSQPFPMRPIWTWRW